MTFVNPLVWFKELQRDAVSWRESRAYRTAVLQPLMALELGPYTRAECLLAAADASVGHELLGHVGWVLYCRSSRGETTLQEAIAVLRRAHGGV